MKALLAVTVMLEAEDLADADVVRKRLLEFLRTDAAVVAVSAPAVVAGR